MGLALPTVIVKSSRQTPPSVSVVAPVPRMLKVSKSSRSQQTSHWHLSIVHVTEPVSDVVEG